MEKALASSHPAPEVEVRLGTFLDNGWFSSAVNGELWDLCKAFTASKTPVLKVTNFMDLTQGGVRFRCYDGCGSVESVCKK